MDHHDGVPPRVMVADDDRAIRESLARALELYVEACQQDVARGCSVAGDLATHGDEVPRDEARGLALREKACRLGDAIACNNLGVAYERMGHVTEAKEAYSRATALSPRYVKARVNSDRVAKFVKKYADLHGVLLEASQAWAADVVSGAYPDAEHTYE